MGCSLVNDEASIDSVNLPVGYEGFKGLPYGMARHGLAQNKWLLASGIAYGITGRRGRWGLSEYVWICSIFGGVESKGLDSIIYCFQQLLSFLVT
jgi:hypothetical protein